MNFKKPRLEVIEKIFKKRMNNPDQSNYQVSGGFYELFRPEISFGWAAKGLIRYADSDRKLKYWAVLLDTKEDFIKNNDNIVKRVANSFWNKYKAYGINKTEYKKAMSRRRRKKRTDKSYKQYKNYRNMKWQY
jgi:hypothetical protein